MVPCKWREGKLRKQNKDNDHNKRTQRRRWILDETIYDISVLNKRRSVKRVFFFNVCVREKVVDTVYGVIVCKDSLSRRQNKITRQVVKTGVRW